MGFVKWIWRSVLRRMSRNMPANKAKVCMMACGAMVKENVISAERILIMASSVNLENTIPKNNPMAREIPAIIKLSHNRTLARFHFPIPRIL